MCGRGGEVRLRWGTIDQSLCGSKVGRCWGETGQVAMLVVILGVVVRCGEGSWCCSLCGGGGIVRHWAVVVKCGKALKWNAGCGGSGERKRQSMGWRVNLPPKRTTKISASTPPLHVCSPPSSPSTLRLCLLVPLPLSLWPRCDVATWQQNCG